MRIETRPAGEGDAEIVARAVALLLEELAPGHVADVPALEANARKILALPGVFSRIAEIDGAFAGAVVANECAAIYAGGVFGEITELYVRPGFRSRGVAAALVAEVKKLGCSRDWRRIEVGAPEQPKWARTLAFYEREGFALVGPRLRILL